MERPALQARFAKQSQIRRRSRIHRLNTPFHHMIYLQDDIRIRAVPNIKYNSKEADIKLRERRVDNDTHASIHAIEVIKCSKRLNTRWDTDIVSNME